MDWESIKHIYRNVLIDGVKIKYLGKDKYILTQFYSSGRKYREIEFKNGKQQGKDIVWYKDGTKERITNYKNNIVHGEHKIWFTNGKVYCNIKYDNGIEI